jgi:hypothetical protein
MSRHSWIRSAPAIIAIACVVMGCKIGSRQPQSPSVNRIVDDLCITRSQPRVSSHLRPQVSVAFSGDSLHCGVLLNEVVWSVVDGRGVGRKWARDGVDGHGGALATTSGVFGLAIVGGQGPSHAATLGSGYELGRHAIDVVGVVYSDRTWVACHSGLYKWRGNVLSHVNAVRCVAACAMEGHGIVVIEERSSDPVESDRVISCFAEDGNCKWSLDAGAADAVDGCRGGLIHVLGSDGWIYELDAKKRLNKCFEIGVSSPYFADLGSIMLVASGARLCVWDPNASPPCLVQSVDLPGSASGLVKAPDGSAVAIICLAWTPDGSVREIITVLDVKSEN